MDAILQKNVDDLQNYLKQAETQLQDPVARLMLVALTQQTQKILDEINSVPQKVVQKLATYFLPREKMKASPALCLVAPSLKSRKGIEPHLIAEDTFFTFKGDKKQPLTYFPLFKNLILPVTGISEVKEKVLLLDNERIPLNFSRKGQLWIGLELPVEIETLENVSFLIKNSGGLVPRKIFAGADEIELAFASASDISAIPMAEPFDSQQVSPDSLEVMRHWQKLMANNDAGRLIYITDKRKDRDAFKFKGYPKIFRQLLEETELKKLSEKPLLWLRFDFGHEVNLSQDIEVIPNVMPVVNVNVNTVTLNSSSPISRLDKEEDSYFLWVLDTSLQSRKQGFPGIEEEVVIRDFDTEVYNSDRLFRDIRNLYNKFVDDYHVFIDYHSLKDGELLKNLRELVNRLGKSLNTSDIKNAYEEGTYAMRSISLLGKTNPVKVSYLTTRGKAGNLPKTGELMENKKDAAIEKDVKIVGNATGGTDRPGHEQEYEMLRYYTLTSDRLFTKMDIDAFLRMELLKEFGKEEMKRISFTISIEGAASEKKLVRGLYIDIRFKDSKNYRKAVEEGLAINLRRKIMDKSCLSMPVTVTLIEGD